MSNEFKIGAENGIVGQFEWQYSCWGEMAYISLWAGDLGTATNLPSHLRILYDSIGNAHFERDPAVCAERELVPVEELIEPFSLTPFALREAQAFAMRESLKLAAVVVAIYTHRPLDEDQLRPHGCGLKFIGTYPE